MVSNSTAKSTVLIMCGSANLGFFNMFSSCWLNTMFDKFVYRSGKICVVVGSGVVREFSLFCLIRRSNLSLRFLSLLRFYRRTSSSKSSIRI